ncbi:MAG: hypothetical protein Q8L55_06360 [Phycisphaerales bacterium]|nr:hypothetical protein [Phycisphaerales bacterium]
MNTPSDSARMLDLKPTGGGWQLLSTRGLAGCTALLVAAGAGCSSWGSGEKVGQTVQPAAFHKEMAAAPKGVADGTAVATGEQKAPVAVPTPAPEAAPARPDQRAPRVVAVVDAAPHADTAAAPVGRDVVADSMVGQIQGRPVYASEVLDPMDGQLRAAARNVKTPAAAQVWVREAARLIRQQVELRVRDELLLGEARARLTPEQKQGLIYFLKRVDQWASGQQGGSQAQAEEAIKERTGEDYDKFLRSQRDQTLIRELIKENVTPNVRVPWRKVERYYEENQATLNPPPFGVVRIVMIDGANAAAVARAQASASASDGGAFRELAASEANVFDRARAGLVVRPLDKPFAEVEWVGNKTWNEAASKLREGEAAGPIDTAEYKVWVRREADYSTPHRTLEDAQLEIFARLTQSKEGQEQSVFFGQLLGKGSFTPVGRMTMELLVLAAQRHLSPEIASAVRDANPLGTETAPALERSPALPELNDVSVNPPPTARPKGTTPESPR